MSFVESKWLSLSIGGAIVGAAVTLPEIMLSHPAGQPIFLLGILMLFDGGVASRVISLATINGPERRRLALERAFYAMPVANRRYILAIALFMLASVSVAALPMGDWYLILMTGAVVVYGSMAMAQLFQCRKRAAER